MQSEEPLGCVSLDDVDVLVDTEADDYSDKFKFKLVTPYATHLLATETEAERNAWIEVAYLYKY